jgi:hypothetical protein
VAQEHPICLGIRAGNIFIVKRIVSVTGFSNRIQGVVLSVCLSINLSIYLPTYLNIYLWLYRSLDLDRFFSFLILYTVGRTPWTGDHPVARPLPTHRRTQTQNKLTHTSMPWVGIEYTIPAFERAKTVHALDHAATVVDFMSSRQPFVRATSVWRKLVSNNAVRDLCAINHEHVATYEDCLHVTIWRSGDTL